MIKSHTHRSSNSSSSQEYVEGTIIGVLT